MRKKPKLEIKLDFIIGLAEIVLKEIQEHPSLRVIREEEGSIYLDFIEDFSELKSLRSVLRASIVVRDSRFHPPYISNHKSILGDLIAMVREGKGEFQSFKILCVGSDSPAVRSIAEYVQDTHGMREEEEADMKIHLFKIDEIWEVGVQVTPRPLSLRDYKIRNMEGAMNPTIAYAVNSLCGLDNAHSYLNVFSGSATLLIEAAQCHPHLKRMIGFDNNKKSISLAIQNIREAGLIRKIQLKEENIFDEPDLGRFDVITSDLPFGMRISKDKNLEGLYRCFIEYCEETLNPEGRLGVYTSEYEILEPIILGSRFEILKTLELKFLTSVGEYLDTRILLCRQG